MVRFTAYDVLTNKKKFHLEDDRHCGGGYGFGYRAHCETPAMSGVSKNVSPIHARLQRRTRIMMLLLFYGISFARTDLGEEVRRRRQ